MTIKELKKQTRGHLHDLWEIAKAGNLDSLSGEERWLAKVMLEHQDQYFNQFEMADLTYDHEYDVDSEENPFLHIMLHSAIERQLEAKDPIETYQFYNSMRKKKVSRHETIHLIGIILAPFMFNVMRQNVPFDEEKYIAALKKYKGKKPERIYEFGGEKIFKIGLPMKKLTSLIHGRFFDGLARFRPCLRPIFGLMIYNHQPDSRTEDLPPAKFTAGDTPHRSVTVFNEPKGQNMIASLIKLFVSNPSVSLLVLGLIASLVSLSFKKAREPSPLLSEALVAYFFLFSIGIGYLNNFIMHVVFAEFTAKFIGWANSPFQLEVGFCQPWHGRGRPHRF